MASTKIIVERFSAVSSKSFTATVEDLRSCVGHPDMSVFIREIGAMKTASEMERYVNAATGPIGLMEFAAFNLGEVLAKELGKSAPQSIRLLIGNPLVMKELVKLVPDAGSYAPVTILIDERADGVKISYDTMVSHLESYENTEVLKIARDLDEKIQSIIAKAVN